MKILYYDLETTGVKYWKNGIHQIAGMVEIDGEIVETFNFNAQPHPKCIIDPEALKVGNVTLEQVQAYPPMEIVYKRFINILAKYIDKFDKKDKFFLCGYNNAAFDNQFLRAFFDQNNDGYFGSWFWNSTIDVFVLASDKLKYERAEMPHFDLASVARHLGIPVKENSLHDALYDVNLTREIYKILPIL